MAMTRTLAQMRTEVRQRADIVNSTYTTDSEIDRWLNLGIRRLYGALVRARGDQYYRVQTDLAQAAGTNIVSNAPAYLKVLALDWITGTYNTPGVELRWSDRDIVDPFIEGGNLSFHYVPESPVLTADGDSFDGINGWEELPILSATIYALIKEESNVEELIRERSLLEAEVKALSANRNYGDPPAVQDVQRSGLVNFFYLIRGSQFDIYRAKAEYAIYAT